MPRQVVTLTLADAREIIAAGEKKAGEIGIPYNLAVVDAVGASGGTVEQDQKVVEAAVAAFQKDR